MFLSAFIANCVYYSLLEAFPYIEFTSLKFLVAVGMFVLKHYVALNYFADNFVPYDEVIGYFTVCLWIVPFTLLISTSAGDNTLPTLGAQPPTRNNGNDTLSHYYAHKKKRSSFLMYIETIKEKFMPYRADKHLY